jgi:hypothetical protein
MKNSLPSLPYNRWEDTLITLHLWTQIVGKIKLKQNSFLNHWWEVALYVTTHGLTSGRIPYKNFAFEISFDFLVHKLTIITSRGEEKIFLLKPCTVADFYDKCMHSLQELGIEVMINTTPSEIPDVSIPFDKDTEHKSYDKKFVERWHSIQLQVSFILDSFRSDFRGKSSPVQFFWGSFDLTTTRFSGKKLPEKADWSKGYRFMRYAENEENFACGFWPGSEKYPYPAFYSYLYPIPKGCAAMKTGPLFSYFDSNLSECILPYEQVRKTRNPQKKILDFFQTTYTEFAKLSKWDINKLKGLHPKIYIDK